MVWNKLRHTAQLIVCAALAACAAAPAPVARACAAGARQGYLVDEPVAAALGAGLPAVIRGAEAVRKSWPGFFGVMETLGAQLERQEQE